jgi:hypothetical protein
VLGVSLVTFFAPAKKVLAMPGRIPGAVYQATADGKKAKKCS